MVFTVVAASAAVGASPSVSVALAQSATTAYRPIEPVRVADTRDGSGITPSGDRTVTVSLQAALQGTPATAAVLSITALGSSGFVTVYPSGTPMPTTSVVNVGGATTVAATTTIARLGPAGSIEVFRSPGVQDVIVDLLGAFEPAATSAAGRLVAHTPRRLIDTRDTGPLERGTSIVVRPDGIPADATAAAITLTAIPHDGAGFATVYPAGSARPLTSVLNVVGAGVVRASSTIVPLRDGAFEVFSSARTDVVVDLAGWFTGPSADLADTGLFVALDTPVRRLDTRTGPALLPRETLEVALGAGASAISGTITYTDAARSGYLTVHPARSGRPLASVVNANDVLDTVANGLVTAVSDAGIAVFSSAGGHLVVDQTGWFTGTPRPNDGVEHERVAGLEYPTGPCDTIEAGLPGLAGPRPSRHVEIGRSLQGRPIHAEYWGPADADQVIVIVGQVHGNECAPQLFVEAIRSRPPTSYGAWLIPTLNPDGHAAGIRQNAAGLDLNKDGGAWSQPETLALMRFTARVRPLLTVHVHSPNGSVGWYGRGAYVQNDPGRSSAQLSGPIAARISARTGLTFTGAGSRPSPSIWFLWQGQRTVLPEHEAVLLELYAISDREVTTARPRPPTRSIADVRGHCQSILDALEISFT